MSKIRKLYYFDKKNTQEMISFLNNNVYDTYINHIMFNPFIPLHHLLPLRFKFLPESYILKDKKEVKGLITIAPINSRVKKMEIQKLLFEEGAREDAIELIQYVVSKYKAMGAVSIIVKVDDYLPDLLSMFVSKCGFSQISYEKLWRVNKFIETDYDKKEFREFRNSDAQLIANLYNEALLPHFRPLLSRDVKEFKETLFKGLSYYSEYKYIIEDKKSKNIIGGISIRTSDNENFVVDIIQTGWMDVDINAILAFATDQIKKRKKRFGLFVKTKRYTNAGEKLEKQFMENGFECVQNQIVLTNSSARVLKNSERTGKYTVLSNLCPSKALPTQKICNKM
ncbi:MAG: hypothetical protein NC408_01205 [Candidatus Gastranaerophilales bacterium]|nr:hypothetical protein [Candidatus Gastranaerophilales bacterium]MCM1073689.1 hypothetical protein [Bacteroides sp.]